MADLRLQVIMQLADKAAAPLRNITRGSKEAAQALKATQQTLRTLNDQQKKLDGLKRHQEELKSATTQSKILKQNLETLRNAHGNSSKEALKAEKAFEKSTRELTRQKDAVFKLRSELTRMGIGSVAQAQTRVKSETARANEQLDKQLAKLQKIKATNAQAARMVAGGAVMSGAGAGMLYGGQKVASGVGGLTGAYATQENATARLKAAMMLANGSVSPAFKQVNDLAKALGNRLPGDTAEFVNMMAMLSRQGLSAKNILSGTGEAAAYLSVMLEKSPVEAAEFAAKMQDATRTVDTDMMSLMDTIQRTFNMGVQSEDMLQAFSKISPALSIIKKSGVDAANGLAPLLAMADQAGMKGEAAGNAFRKIFQYSLDADKIEKANNLLKETGKSLDFSNGKGEFGGLNNMFKQLDKLKGVDTQTRLAVLKKAFGDDAETLQALTLMIDKGQAGYDSVTARMKDQADLRGRVNELLKTTGQQKESAEGNFVNMLAAFGETVKPETTAILKFIQDITASTTTWVEKNPVLAGWLVKIVAVLAIFLVVVGGVALAIGAATAAFGLMLPYLSVLASGLSLVGGAIMFIGRALLMNPIGLIITGIAVAALLIYKYWDQIPGFFRGIWANIKSGAADLWNSFKNLGGMLMDGLVWGVLRKLLSVREAIMGVAASVIGWFKEKLGIKSPSRVFIEAGGYIGEGAALGIQRSSSMVKRAAVGLTAAAVVPFATASIDTRAPLSAGAARPSVVMQGDTITIQLLQGPGQDGQALAREIARVLDQRDRAKQARLRGALSDNS